MGKAGGEGWALGHQEGDKASFSGTGTGGREPWISGNSFGLRK